MRKRLLIADDHALMLSGIAQLLSTDFEIVGMASDGLALVKKAKRLVPDLIVLDIGMPELNGIEATRQIDDALPSTTVIILTQQLSGNYVQAAFRAGARAYVAKQSAATELMEAIHAVFAGKFYVTSLAVPSDTKWSPGGVMDKNPADLFGDELTPRQREVLRLIATGKSAKEISSSLNISTKTVEFHKASLMDQLGMRTTAELTRYAVANGIIHD